MPPTYSLTYSIQTIDMYTQSRNYKSNLSFRQRTQFNLTATLVLEIRKEFANFEAFEMINIRSQYEVCGASYFLNTSRTYYVSTYGAPSVISMYRNKQRFRINYKNFLN
jgi:hypothetical protein